MHNMGDFASNVSVAIGNNTAAATTGSTAGSSMDALKCENQMLAIRQVNSGLSGNTPLITTKMQESTDGTTWTDIQKYSIGGTSTGQNVTFATSIATTASADTPINFDRTLRYIRPFHTITGTGTLTIPLTLLIVGWKKVL